MLTVENHRARFHVHEITSSVHESITSFDSHKQGGIHDIQEYGDSPILKKLCIRFLNFLKRDRLNENQCRLKINLSLIG